MSTKVDFRVDAGNVGVVPGGRDYIEVELEDVELNELIEAIGEDEILNEFDTEDAIKHFGAEDLLDEIGEEQARKHFGIEEE